MCRRRKQKWYNYIRNKTIKISLFLRKKKCEEEEEKDYVIII